MNQFTAGYFSDALFSLFTKKQIDEKIMPLLDKLCRFDIYTEENIDNVKPQFETTIIHNLLQRTLPTRLSSFAEDYFAQRLRLTEKSTDEYGNIIYRSIKQDISEFVLRSLHIIEQDEITETFSFEQDEHGLFNQEVLRKILGEIYGKHIFSLLETQITYDEIAESEENLILSSESGLLKEFASEKIDFVLRFPYPYNGIKGLIIETQHNPSPGGGDFITAGKKRQLSETLGYEYIIIKKGKTEEGKGQLKKFAYIEAFEQYKKNLQNPIYSRESGKNAMQFSLSPIAGARMQMLIVRLILAGKLDLKAEKWSIAVLERDIPAAAYAFDDLKTQFENLFTLRGNASKFPKISLTIFASKHFQDAKLNEDVKIKIQNITDFDTDKKYDLLIDCSVFKTSFSSKDTPKHSARLFTALRSARFSRAKRCLMFCNEASQIQSIIKQGISTAYQESADFFFQSILRKQNLDIDKTQALQAILAGKNILISGPPASGKLLLRLLASQLQTGISVMIVPGKALLSEQFKTARAEFIDSCFYLNSSPKKLHEKKQVIHKLISGEANLLFISPEMLFDDSFREIVNTLLEKGIVFSSVFIDEVQSTSEWSHDFKIEHTGMGKNIRRLFRNADSEREIPVFPMSSGASYDVRFDISEIFRTDQKSDIFLAEHTPQQHYKIHSCKDGPRTRDVDTALTFSLQNKLNELVNIIKSNIAENVKTLVITNNKTDFAKIGDLLTTVFSGTPIGKFSEFFEDFDKSISDFKQYLSGKIKILISDDRTLPGLDIFDTEQMIFFNMPASPESFMQLTARIGKNGKDAVIRLIYDKTTVSVIEPLEVHREHGEFETIEQAAELIPDEIIIRNAIKNKYPGRQKEFIVIAELLSKIDSPQLTPIDLIRRKVFKTFGERVDIVCEPVDDPYIVTLYKNNKLFGHIDYKTEIIDTQNSSFDKNLSFVVLNLVKNEIDSFFVSKKDVLHRIGKDLKTSGKEGIEPRLDNMQPGETREIEIFTENNAAFEILDLLRKHVSEKFMYENIIDALESSTRHRVFISKLNQIADTNNVTKEIDVPVRLEKLFYAYRNKYLTLTALNRLTTLQIIDDFEFNDTRQTVKIRFRKKEDETYKISLFQYLNNFVSTEKSNEFFALFETYTGGSFIRKSVIFLINFIYDYVAEKRISASEESKEFYKALAQNKSTQKSLDGKTENYFAKHNTAKYLNTLVFPSLQIGTFNLKISSFDTVMKYIHLTKDIIDTREHVKESTEILLKENEKNYTILLLNAFVLLWSDKDKEEIFEKAFDRMTEGFALMEKLEEIEYEELSARRNMYLQELYRRDGELETVTAPLINIKTHTAWLETFNKTFLENFETVKD